MRKLKRVIYSQNEAGELVTTSNPILIYLDSSAWIDISKAYVLSEQKILDEISKTIGDSDFRILVSVINFFELIRTKGDVSINFSQEYLRVFTKIPMISANQPTIITDQEVYGFLNETAKGTYIFDSDHVALENMQEAFERRARGDNDWFLEHRKFWDERQERDRVLDLHADIWELSGAKPSPQEVSKLREDILSGPIDQVRKLRANLIRTKQVYRGRKLNPDEKETILGYAANRITTNIERKYGPEKVRMLISNPLFVFPRQKNLIRHVIKDIRRGMQLSFQTVKNELPGLYWQAKVTYYNCYVGYQSSGGQSGDRNHAVYIPYCNYFATCDRMLIRALESECQEVYSKDNLRLFKTTT